MRWWWLALLPACSRPSPSPGPDRPELGATWTIAGVPNLGALDKPGEQPVDFAVWPAGDGRWQLWSCIRGSGEEGYTRLLYRWEGASLRDPSWTPMGIAMRAGRVAPDDAYDPSFGEARGGLQAPFVVADAAGWRMFYGTWGNLGEQRSSDGKAFARVRQADGTVHLLAGTDSKRDPMLLPVDGVDYLYFTANPNGQGGVYLATSQGGGFSAPRLVAFGGQAGTGPSAAECPYVVAHGGSYYLFRTSSERAAGNYQPGVATYVYASSDPTDFGVDDDSRLVAVLPIAAPEIHTVDGVDYIAHLLPSLDGIAVSELHWR